MRCGTNRGREGEEEEEVCRVVAGGRGKDGTGEKFKKVRGKKDQRSERME